MSFIFKKDNNQHLYVGLIWLLIGDQVFGMEVIPGRYGLPRRITTKDGLGSAMHQINTIKDCTIDQPVLNQ